MPAAATDWQAEARAAAAKHGIDPDVFLRLIGNESAGNPNAVSPKGAVGMGQLMPDTARDLGVTDRTDRASNLDGSARYLKQQLDSFGGDYRKAVAAYNAGPGNVQKYGGVPPFKETQDEVARVADGRSVSRLAGRVVRTPEGKMYRIPAGATDGQVSKFLASMKRPSAEAPATVPGSTATATPAAPLQMVPSHAPTGATAMPPEAAGTPSWMVEASAKANAVRPSQGRAGAPVPGPNAVEQFIGGAGEAVGEGIKEFVTSIPAQVKEFYGQASQRPFLPGESPETTAARGEAYQGAARTIAAYTPLDTPIGPVLPQMVAQGGAQLLQAGAPVETPDGFSRPPTPLEVGKRVGGGALGLAMGLPGVVHAATKAHVPTPEETAAVHENITPPVAPKASRAEAERQTKTVADAVAGIHQRAAQVGPVGFEAQGVKIQDAYVVPNLVRYFPGEENALRITVVDNESGEMHSLQMPDVAALRQALRFPTAATVGRVTPKPEPFRSAAMPRTAETAPLSAEPIVPPPSTTPMETDVKAGTLRTATAARAIESLKRQIAAGGARVPRLKRRLAKLQADHPSLARESQAPKAPSNGTQAPSAPVKPVGGEKPSERTVPRVAAATPKPPPPAPLSARAAIEKVQALEVEGQKRLAAERERKLGTAPEQPGGRAVQPAPIQGSSPAPTAEPGPAPTPAAKKAETPEQRLDKETAVTPGTAPLTKGEARDALRREAVYHGMDGKRLNEWYQRIFGKQPRADNVTYSQAHDKILAKLHEIAGVAAETPERVPATGKVVRAESPEPARSGAPSSPPAAAAPAKAHTPSEEAPNEKTTQAAKPAGTGVGGSARPERGVGSEQRPVGAGGVQRGPAEQRDAGRDVRTGRAAQAGEWVPTLREAREEHSHPADEAVIPAKYREQLYPHQRQAVAKMVAAMDSGEGGGLLASGTGAGKTRIELVTAEHYRQQGKAVVIVSPSEVIKQDWDKRTYAGDFKKSGDVLGVKLELWSGKYGGQPEPGKISLTTLEQVSNLQPSDNMVLILDESHKFKNVGSKRTKAMLKLIKDAHAVLYASATPKDTIGNFRYLTRSGILEGGTYKEMLDKLGLNLRTSQVAQILMPGDMPEVGETIRFTPDKTSPWQYRINGDVTEVKNVDGKTVVTVVGARRSYNIVMGTGEFARFEEGESVTPKFGMTEEKIAAHVEELFDRMVAAGRMVRHEISLADVPIEHITLDLPAHAKEQMRELESEMTDGMGAEGVSRLEKARVKMALRRQLEHLKIDKAVDLIHRELDRGRQVVLFASRVNESTPNKRIQVFEEGKWKSVLVPIGRFRTPGTIETMLEQLKEKGIKVGEIHGGKTKKEQLQAMARFQAGADDVVLATPESGGTGIDLDHQDKRARPRTLIIMTSPFDAMGYTQAVGRIIRATTLTRPHVITLYFDHSIDDWNRGIIEKKLTDLGATVQGEIPRLKLGQTVQPEEPPVLSGDAEDDALLDFTNKFRRRFNMPEAPAAAAEPPEERFSFETMGGLVKGKTGSAAVAEPKAAPRARTKGAPQAELGGEVSQDFALVGQKAPAMASASGRSFVQEFEDLARQGKSLEDATAEARRLSGSEPPDGLDLDARWSRVRREATEEAGQEDMFSGAAMLGRPAGTTTEADIDQAPREAPPPVAAGKGEATKPSEAKDVPLEGLWYWEGFQNRDVSRGTPPTQNPAELVNANHIRMLAGERGFDIDEVVRRPVIIWRDEKGELGPAGRRYVIDGHHRAYMAREAGAKRLPSVEIFGDLAYAKDQARLANVAGVPNSYSEQARIARELHDRGDPLARVGTQLRVRESKVRGMVDFAHVDPDVRAQFFPAGNETSLLGSTSYGEVVGRYARESPDLMTVNMQRQWFNQAVNDETRPHIFAQQVRDWHTIMRAAKQETLDIGGAAATRLSMTPKQFADTVGRMIGAIDSVKRQTDQNLRALENVGEMAKGEGHALAFKQISKMAHDAAERGKTLVKAKKTIEADIKRVVIESARGDRDLASALDEIQKVVDQVVGKANGSAPLLGEGGYVRLGPLVEALGQALRRLSGIARREPKAKRAGKGEAPKRPAVVQKIMDALEEAEPVREQQEAGYTAERIQRLRQAIENERGKSGMARHRARRAAFKGELPKVQFESIAKALSQQNVDDLVELIYAHPGLDFFQKDNAIDALKKLLGELGGEVPQMRELELLEVVFGSDLVSAILKKRPQIQSMRALKKVFYTIGNTSRALITTFDLSAPLRQGLFLGPSFPKQWGSAFINMHRHWASEENFRAAMDRIYRDPRYALAFRAGLSITRPGSPIVSAQEEAFLGANFAEKIPLGIGNTVRRSDRAYAGFLNQLRWDVFNALVELARANDRNAWDVKKEPTLARDIAKFVNSATGRGDSKFISDHAQGLNAMFFAPRLMKSRFDLTNPMKYMAGDPFVRRQFLRSGLMLSGAAALVLTLAGWLGAQVDWDRLNGDWGKIRVGNTVYDVLGGIVQYLRLYPTFAEALYHQVRGERYKYGTAWDVVERFGEHKLSPIASFVLGALRNQATEKDIAGPRGHFQMGPEALKLFIPLIAQDFWQVYHDDPRQLPAAVGADAYGVSVQTYPPPRQ